MGQNLNSVAAFNQANVLEHVQHSWYDGLTVHPFDGDTNPVYSTLNTAGKYSWAKAPRYQTQPMEVGPPGPGSGGLRPEKGTLCRQG